MNKHESKYQNTAFYMNEALLSLIEQKNFEFITIKEVCKKAGVNRSTFYLHYQNLNELLEETINNLNKKFFESFEEKALDEKIFTREKYLKPYLKFIKENKKIFVLTAKYPELFQSDRTFNSLYKEIFSPILNAFIAKEKEKEYIFEFYFKGVLGIVYKWINNDCLDDEDLIIDLIEKCTGRNEKNN